MKNHLLKILIFVYFVASFFLVAKFTFKPDIYNFFKLSWQPLTIKILILSFSIAFVHLLSYFKRINQFLSLFLLLILLAILTGNTWPMLLLLFIVLAGLATGKYFHNLFNIDNRNLVDIFVLGIGFLGTIVGLIAVTKFNYPGIYALLLVIPIFFQRKNLIFLTSGFNFLIQERYKFNLTNLLIQSLLVIYFLYSMMPETGHDALATHLFIPSNVSFQHQWKFDPELYVFAVTPLLGDWIYTLSYMLAGEVSSKLITFLFICILAYYVKRLAQWASVSKNIDNLSSLLFLSTPLVFLESSSAYIDSIWTAFVIASFISFSHFFFLKKTSLSSAKSFAIYNAFALQTKAISFTSQLGLLPLIFLKIFINKSIQKIDKFFIYALAAALIIGFIPYYIAYVKSGNPVFPLFNNIFKSIYFPFVAFENPLYPSGLRWDFLYQATFHTKHFLESNDGGIGYIYFLFLIPSLFKALINKNHKIIFLASIAFFSLAFTFMGTSYLRYIFPFFVIASAIIGASYNISSNHKFSKKILLSILICSLMLNLIYFKAAVNFSNSLNLKPMLSSEDKRIFLRGVMPIKDAFDIVNVLNINANPVLIFGNETATGINADAVYVSWYNPKIVEMLTNAQNEINTLESLNYFHIKYIIIDYSVLPAVADPTKIRKLLEDASEEILRINNVTIRKIKTDS